MCPVFWTCTRRVVCGITAVIASNAALLSCNCTSFSTPLLGLVNVIFGICWVVCQTITYSSNHWWKLTGRPTKGHLHPRQDTAATIAIISLGDFVRVRLTSYDDCVTCIVEYEWLGFVSVTLDQFWHVLPNSHACATHTRYCRCHNHFSGRITLCFHSLAIALGKN